MTARYVIALDQGTTSSRALVVDHDGAIAAEGKVKFAQHFPQPGWVEHDPEEIFSSQMAALEKVVDELQLRADDIAAIGIANQRETTVVWDRRTGQPIANAIVWQCRRTADLVERVCADTATTERIHEKTGLLPDAYFSASKIRWLLDETPGAWELAREGHLACGTVDSWLLYRLTGGAVHATDYTNASRTMLFDIHECRWDEWLLDLWGIPASLLPAAMPSAAAYGTIAEGPLAGVPITGIAGDQQAALFGQCCFAAGQAKSTYGTGCFVLMNTGTEAKRSQNKLVTTIAASAPGQPVTYALEGSAYCCASLIQWARDLGLYEKSYMTEQMARSVKDNGGVYVVPALTGMGAPYWDSSARGAILGITRGTTKNHIARAVLEAVAYQALDLIRAMEDDAGHRIAELNVDGGVSANDFCMQFQSDMLEASVRRPANAESTAMGAAFLAGLEAGFWAGTDELAALRRSDTVFRPEMDDSCRSALLRGWHEAIGRVVSTSQE